MKIRYLNLRLLPEYTLTIYKDDRTTNKCYQDITTVRIKDENVIVRLLQTLNNRFEYLQTLNKPDHLFQTMTSQFFFFKFSF